jgi:hypothetical protein
VGTLGYLSTRLVSNEWFVRECWGESAPARKSRGRYGEISAIMHLATGDMSYVA